MKMSLCEKCIDKIGLYVHFDMPESRHPCEGCDSPNRDEDGAWIDPTYAVDGYELIKAGVHAMLSIKNKKHK